MLWERSPGIFSYLPNFLSQMYLVIKHFLSAWSGPGRVSFHKHWQVNLTALPVSAGGFICIVIVLVKQNNRSQFMERPLRGWSRRMRRPLLPQENPEETQSRGRAQGRRLRVLGRGNCPMGGTCKGGERRLPV